MIRHKKGITKRLRDGAARVQRELRRAEAAAQTTLLEHKRKAASELAQSSEALREARAEGENLRIGDGKEVPPREREGNVDGHGEARLANGAVQVGEQPGRHPVRVPRAWLERGGTAFNAQRPTSRPNFSRLCVNTCHPTALSLMECR